MLAIASCKVVNAIADGPMMVSRPTRSYAGCNAAVRPIIVTRTVGKYSRTNNDLRFKGGDVCRALQLCTCRAHHMFVLLHGALSCMCNTLPQVGKTNVHVKALNSHEDRERRGPAKVCDDGQVRSVVEHLPTCRAWRWSASWRGVLRITAGACFK